MKKEISEALLDFYEKMLAPEFSEIKNAQSEQEERVVSVLGHFDSIYKRFDRLEDEYYTITHGLKRIEEKLEKNTEERKDIEKRFKELKQQSDRMQQKIAAIEQELFGGLHS